MANSDSQRRCVFVGNIPYDATEEQLIQICEEVGPVVSFRLVIDRETGKPKGYGFCEYKDEETALSARRNLQGYEINGRQLRVDFAENDKNADRSREQGRGGPGMVTNVDPQKHIADSALHQPMGMSVAMTAAAVMAGALGAAQTSSSFSQSGVDPLTLHLSKMSRGHLTDIMTEFKAMSIQRKDQARQLLLAYPNLCKAIFQMQLMLGMVTQTMLQMPNIRQSAAPPLQPLLLDGQRSQHLATQTLPGLPPLPHSMPPQARPQVQLPQPMQQSQLPTHSGTFPPLRPQMNLPIIPPVHVASSLKQQMLPSFLREAGPVASTNLAYNNQLGPTNMSFQPSSLTRPPLSEQSFQGNRPALTGTLDNVNRDSHGHQATNSSSLFSKPAHSSGFPEEKRGSINNLDPLSRPTKIQRLNDGRTSYSSPDVSVATPTSGPSSQVSVAEMVSNSDKQSTQMQLPPDVESALLQQVLSLTPEQLSSLPPDQQQQVIQLQQMLRQPT